MYMAFGFATATHRKKSVISIALILHGDKWQIFADRVWHDFDVISRYLIENEENTKYCTIGNIVVKYRNGGIFSFSFFARYLGILFYTHGNV